MIELAAIGVADQGNYVLLLFNSFQCQVSICDYVYARITTIHANVLYILPSLPTTKRPFETQVNTKDMIYLPFKISDVTSGRN